MKVDLIFVGNAETAAAKFRRMTRAESYGKDGNALFLEGDKILRVPMSDVREYVTFASNKVKANIQTSMSNR